MSRPGRGGTAGTVGTGRPTQCNGHNQDFRRSTRQPMTAGPRSSDPDCRTGLLLRPPSGSRLPVGSPPGHAKTRFTSPAHTTNRPTCDRVSTGLAALCRRHVRYGPPGTSAPPSPDRHESARSALFGRSTPGESDVTPCGLRPRSALQGLLPTEIGPDLVTLA